jgi:CubicO group peptidase (beta-lactamase class C family)
MHFRSALLPAAVTLAAAAAVAPATAQIVAYHDQDGAQHQLHYNQLSNQGYRMIALSIYGTAQVPLYAAVWVQRAGPAYAACHGVDGAGYQSFVDTWWPLGYRPRIVSASGTFANARFAAVFELTNAPGSANHGLTEQQYQDARSAAALLGQDVTAVDIYGAANDPRYVVAFGPVNAGQAEVVSGNVDSYQEHFDALGAGHARPALVGFNDSNRFVSLWQSNDVGDWVAHHDMTSADYQNLANQYWPARYPISVQGSGSGAGARFAAVFAPTDLPLTPVWTTTGQAVPALGAFDTWAQNWMAANETRAASLAVVRDGRLVLARGYTRAPAGYPITQPTSLFEIASCTKPLTSIVMHQHFEDPQANLLPDQGMLGFFAPLAAADPACAQITLHSLLTHQGGWDRNVSPDPMVGLDATIAGALTQSMPIGKQLITSYMVGTQQLDFTPNNDSQYSNFGFSLLGQVLERRNPGLSYEQIVNQRLFAPLGITRPRMARSTLAGLHPGEVTYHPYVPMLRRSVLSDEQPWVAGQYGGLNKENMDSHGGWVMAAPDFAKVLAAFDLGASNPVLGEQATEDMWTVEPGYGSLMRGWFRKNVSDGMGGQVAMSHHNGRLFGTVSFVARRADGLSFVFLTNGDRNNLFGDVHGEQLSNLANGITAWPSHDLFPRCGLRSFVRVPGSITPVGTGCGLGTTGIGVPSFAAAGTPDVGESLTFTLGNGPAAQLAAMVIGFAQVQTSLAPLGAPACWSYTQPLGTFFAVTTAAGSAAFPWDAPASASAIGLPVMFQGAVLNPVANALGLQTTRGLRAVLGGWQ